MVEELTLKKSPGLDELISRFHKTFKNIWVPILTKVYNECLSLGTLPKSVRRSALIILSKGKYLTHIENWQPIAFLNVNHKVLAKVLLNWLVKFAPWLLSGTQHWSIQGLSTFSDVLGV